MKSKTWIGWWRFLPCGAVGLAWMGGAEVASGCSFPGPLVYLSNGNRITGTPEFYWELECKRMASDFHPTERGVTGDAAEAALSAELEQATKDGKIKMGGADSEFNDYNAGAFAYHRGKENWNEARKAWLTLLARPEKERQSRTVWAAYMLGKMSMEEGKPEASDWFEKTRQYAKAGFADSIGLAADSYGWEARSEWKQGHQGKAAGLYLNQLALGDQSAIDSLGVLIPASPDESGTTNNGEPPLTTEERAAAVDPLLRRVVTASILAFYSGDNVEDSASNDWGIKPAARWLKAVDEAHLKSVDDGEYLGWVAYTVGQYKDAERWVGLCGKETAMGDWLRAKLELRQGKTRRAAEDLEKAWNVIRDPVAYSKTGRIENAELRGNFVYTREEWGFPIEKWMTGDLGAALLLRSDYVQALDTFLKGGLWEDAAYVAERVLTLDELKSYVDAMPPDPPQRSPSDDEHPFGEPSPGGSTSDMRYLLGRRLVRERYYTLATRYLPPGYGGLATAFARALKAGGDTNLKDDIRAAAYSRAAWIARHDGMEIMGTEVAPDEFNMSGAYPGTAVARNRLKGVNTIESFDGDKKVETPVALKILPGEGEVARLKAHPVQPEVRYHYRVLAARIALKAARLMKDNNEELADTLNRAGIWVNDRDENMGNQIYAMVEERCPDTHLGKRVVANHWFIDEDSPWNEKQVELEKALHSDLKLPEPW